MKIDNATAIARRNQQLGTPVLSADNCLFAALDHKRNIWWFDVPVKRLHTGLGDWINLLLHTPENDQLQHLKVPTSFLRTRLEEMEVRNAHKRRTTISLALSADRDAWLQDQRPGGNNVSFARFLQS